jgi:hypothetical protein
LLIRGAGDARLRVFESKADAQSGVLESEADAQSGVLEWEADAQSRVLECETDAHLRVLGGSKCEDGCNMAQAFEIPTGHWSSAGKRTPLPGAMVCSRRAIQIAAPGRRRPINWLGYQ